MSWQFRVVLLVGTLVGNALVNAAAIPDAPFWQDVAVRIRQSPDLTNAVFRKVCVDQENGVYVLTDRGVARMFDDTLALDRSFRPLTGQVPRDIAMSPGGDLYYLFSDRTVSKIPDDFEG